MLRIALVASLLTLAFAANAQADSIPSTVTFPGETLVSGDPVIVGAINAANDYWTRVAPERVAPCPVQPYIYDDPDPEVNSRGEMLGCRIWIVRRLYNYVAKAKRRTTLIMFCLMVTHERGHNLGFEHSTDGGIMDPYPVLASAPAECHAWANQLARRTQARRDHSQKITYTLHGVRYARLSRRDFVSPSFAR